MPKSPNGQPRILMQPTESHRLYWKKNLVLTAVLLLLWFVLTFGVSYFARDLSFRFFGWPFSFWMGAQGAPLLYCLIVGVYAWYMNRLDIEHDVSDGDED